MTVLDIKLRRQELVMAKRKQKRKYGPKASQDVERAVREMKEGTLKSGRSGKKVTDRRQAVAIGLSEARKEGARVPPPKAK